VWSELRLRGRWVHADTGELTVDKPFLYEAGWGKKLTYCFAVRAREAVDVTRRYTQRWEEVKSRRDLCSEAWLEAHLRGLRAQLERGMSPEEQARLHAEQEAEMRELLGERGVERAPLPEEQQGRITGDAAWHHARGENTGT
jgi:peptide-N4-(N-acetyl-beta-glucosaminyl)asparagine amidase